MLKQCAFCSTAKEIVRLESPIRTAAAGCQADLAVCRVSAAYRPNGPPMISLAAAATGSVRVGAVTAP